MQAETQLAHQGAEPNMQGLARALNKFLHDLCMPLCAMLTLS